LLADQHPGDFSFKADLASVYGEQGAALARAGRDDLAAKAIEQSLEYARAVLARDPEQTAQRLVVADGCERLAVLAQKHSKPVDAAPLWREALEIRTDFAQLDPHSVPAQAALALTLAHLGRGDESLKKAEDLLRSYAARPAVLLPLARCFAACTAAGSNDAHRRRATALALDSIGAAIRHGYRDPVAIRTDPDLIPLFAEPSFKNLVDSIKP
jgi:hypothetical protein